MADTLAISAETDLEIFDQIERQNSVVVNHHKRRQTKCWSVSPSLARAAAASRCKRPQSVAKPAPARPAPEVATVASLPDGALYRLVLDYQGLKEAFADRIHDLNVPLTEDDAAGDLTRGNCQKLLVKSDAKWARQFGWESLGKMLKGTGLALAVIVDDARFAPIKAQMQQRKLKQR